MLSNISCSPCWFYVYCQNRHPDELLHIPLSPKFAASDTSLASQSIPILSYALLLSRLDLRVVPAKYVRDAVKLFFAKVASLYRHTTASLVTAQARTEAIGQAQQSRNSLAYFARLDHATHETDTLRGLYTGWDFKETCLYWTHPPDVLTRMCSWVLADAPKTGKSDGNRTTDRSPKKKRARREHVKQYPADLGLSEDAAMHEGIFVALY